MKLKTLYYRLLFTIILAFFVVLPIQSFSQKDSIKISILTASQGTQSHSIFGHTALRVRDLNQNTDIVYNFGLFDFDTPMFFYKFLAGKLLYNLGSHSYMDFLTIYASKNRGVWEQHLDLKTKTKRRISDTLKYLIKPQNKYYHYEFFDKNCTSQIRDILLETIKISDSFSKITVSGTYRDMLNYYLNNRPWYKLGINLITGTYVDKELSYVESMALPDMLKDELNQLQINRKPIVYKQHVVIQYKPGRNITGKIFSPFSLFTLLLIVYLFTKWRWIAIISILFVAIVGSILTFLWAITEHIDLQNNYDLLIANPFYFMLLFITFLKERITIYLAFTLLILLLLRAVISMIGIQELDYAFIPIILLNAFVLIEIIKKKRLKIHQA